jgi:hypothetical protein
MALLLWRLLTLLLASLSMALSFCHVMELAPRLLWAPELWMQTTNFGGLYYLFGRVGAVIDVGTVVVAAVLVVLSRGRSRPFRLALAGAILFAIALATWFGVVAPMNGIMAHWSEGSVPAGFYGVRNQWEFGHATVWLIKFLGLTCLFLSVLSETPKQKPI